MIIWNRVLKISREWLGRRKHSLEFGSFLLFFFFLFPDSEFSSSLFFQSFFKTMEMSQITLGRIQIEVSEVLKATFKLWSSASPTSVILDFIVSERKAVWVKSALCKIFHKIPWTIKWSIFLCWLSSGPGNDCFANGYFQYLGGRVSL